MRLRRNCVNAPSPQIAATAMWKPPERRIAFWRSPRRSASDSSLHHPAQARDVRRLDPLRRFAGDRRFQHLAAEEDVVRVGDRRGGDERAAVALDRDDVVVREVLQRAADDRAAGAKDRAELLFGELRAGRQAMLHHRFEDAAVDRVGPAATRRLRPFLRKFVFRHRRTLGARRAALVFRQSATWGANSLSNFVYKIAVIVDIGRPRFRRSLAEPARKSLTNQWTPPQGGVARPLLPGSGVIPRHASAMAQSANLELVRVSKRYGATLAVDAIDLRVPAGGYCCLLGPSGCGKTSTLRMIAGHETVSEGDILIGDANVTDLPPAKRGTAMMFQSYALFPHLSCVDNVAFSLKMRGVDKAKRREQAMEFLELVAMTPFAERVPAQLSGGQQQRVALARALITHPQILLLDEPLVGARPVPARAHARRVEAGCSGGSASPSSTSPTARTKRSRSPTSWW